MKEKEGSELRMKQLVFSTEIYHFTVITEQLNSARTLASAAVTWQVEGLGIAINRYIPTTCMWFKRKQSFYINNHK